jgi:hypothetical protein
LQKDFLTMSRLRIVLAHGSPVRYPEGGGMLMCFLQHFLGLRDLGHDVYWLAVLKPSSQETTRRQVDTFFQRMRNYGLADRCVVLIVESQANPSFDLADCYGMSKDAVKELIVTSDLLWNYVYSIQPPLLNLFKRRVLIDLDPGILQIASFSRDIGLENHHVFLTVGSKLHDPDCEVPTLNRVWHKFLPVMYLPLWRNSNPPVAGSFTSVTEWSWGDMEHQGRRLSLGKRDAYHEYLDLPARTGYPFELAANIWVDDGMDDRQILIRKGWRWVDPHEVAGSPSAYQEYIEQSRAEICCPKPIYRELKTGWFSDRSAAYLASGRPVLMGETGLSDHFPTGEGLVTFRNMDEAGLSSSLCCSKTICRGILGLQALVAGHVIRLWVRIM